MPKNPTEVQRLSELSQNGIHFMRIRLEEVKNKKHKNYGDLTAYYRFSSKQIYLTNGLDATASTIYKVLKKILSSLKRLVQLFLATFPRVKSKSVIQ